MRKTHTDTKNRHTDTLRETHTLRVTQRHTRVKHTQLTEAHTVKEETHNTPGRERHTY